MYQNLTLTAKIDEKNREMMLAGFYIKSLTRELVGGYEIAT